MLNHPRAKLNWYINQSIFNEYKYTCLNPLLSLVGLELGTLCDQCTVGFLKGCISHAHLLGVGGGRNQR